MAFKAFGRSGTAVTRQNTERRTCLGIEVAFRGVQQVFDTKKGMKMADGLDYNGHNWIEAAAWDASWGIMKGGDLDSRYEVGDEVIKNRILIVQLCKELGVYFDPTEHGIGEQWTLEKMYPKPKKKKCKTCGHKNRPKNS